MDQNTYRHSRTQDHFLKKFKSLAVEYKKALEDANMDGSQLDYNICSMW